MERKFERSRSLPSWFQESDIDILEAVRIAAARIEAGVPYPEPFEIEGPRGPSGFPKIEAGK